LLPFRPLFADQTGFHIELNGVTPTGHTAL
jgi:hypothetical protein